MDDARKVNHIEEQWKRSVEGRNNRILMIEKLFFLFSYFYASYARQVHLMGASGEAVL